ncbi:hypothetical protein UFOVP116_238 [uncultured Caudovirales phage]|uniref:Uncharacterized protein n=1 Tax=uncultured Caudovirales phage TaxID=2100421 RepID=A0A6J5LAC7_9CAUD|nr:hypothetical protein UFOVP116_238 [uncultured Caudovirales phage]
MTALYRITPLEKKSVEYQITATQLIDDEVSRGFTASFHYRWGVGFRAADEKPTVREVENEIECDPLVGFGADLDDVCMVDVTFFNDGAGFAEEEMTTIRELCNSNQYDEEGRSGEHWLNEGSHEFQTGFETLIIYGPMKVDVVDEETGEILEENACIS